MCYNMCWGVVYWEKVLPVLNDTEWPWMSLWTCSVILCDGVLSNYSYHPQLHFSGKCLHVNKHITNIISAITLTCYHQSCEHVVRQILELSPHHCYTKEKPYRLTKMGWFSLHCSTYVVFIFVGKITYKTFLVK